jgi:hypothetical protein
MFGKLFGRKSLSDRLGETRAVTIYGVKFRIKRLDALDYLDGSQSILQIYETYNPTKVSESMVNHKKIKAHYRDVFMSAVVEPKLKRKDDNSEGIFVDNLMTDFNLANRLYEEIFSHTYGKKKSYLRSFLEARSSN